MPKIKIKNPNPCSPMLSGPTLVTGSAFENESGIKLVEVRVDEYKYSKAKPQAEGDWSSWTVLVDIDDKKPHRILSRATDLFRNNDWAEVTINSLSTNGTIANELTPRHNKSYAFAFVEPIFTSASYGNKFYTFYAKYDSVPMGQKVTTDLDFLTAQIPTAPDRNYFTNFTNQVRDFAPGALVDIIDDRDAHNGYIFKPDWGEFV